MIIHPKGGGNFSLEIEKNKIYLINLKGEKKEVFTWAAYSKDNFRGRPHLTVRPEDIVRIGTERYVIVNWKALSWLYKMANCDHRMVVSYKGRSHLRRIDWIVDSGNMYYTKNSNWGYGLFQAGYLGIIK